jgi:hypothetical protein
MIPGKVSDDTRVSAVGGEHLGALADVGRT